MPCLHASGSEWPPLSRAGGTLIKTTLDHALMRGLDTAGPVVRRGASLVAEAPASQNIRLIVDARVLLAVTGLQPCSALADGLSAMTSFS